MHASQALAPVTGAGGGALVPPLVFVVPVFPCSTGGTGVLAMGVGAVADGVGAAVSSGSIVAGACAVGTGMVGVASGVIGAS